MLIQVKRRSRSYRDKRESAQDIIRETKDSVQNDGNNNASSVEPKTHPVAVSSFDKEELDFMFDEDIMLVGKQKTFSEW